MITPPQKNNAMENTENIISDSEFVAELLTFAKKDATYYNDYIKPIIKKARDRELSVCDIFELVLETIDDARALFLDTFDPARAWFFITSGQNRKLTTTEKEYVAAELSICVIEELEC